MTKRRKTFHRIKPYITNNCKKTIMYRQMHNEKTVKNIRVIGTELQVTNMTIYRKSDLIAVIISHIYARKIQKWFKVMHMKIPKGYTDNVCCPISTTELHRVPTSQRYFHSNTFFDKRFLIKYIETSCDFLHPITRVEFTLEDVSELDVSLVDKFNNRLIIQEGIIQTRGLIQTTEIELEYLFNDMTSALREISGNGELRIVMEHIKREFGQVFSELILLDRDRSNIVIKSFIFARKNR